LGNAPHRTRTYNPLIKSQFKTFPNSHVSNNLEESSEVCAPNAHQAESAPPLDPDLALIESSWPDLPEALRAGILAMVRACQPTDSRQDPTTEDA
jgi:hypothetical protein